MFNLDFLTFRSGSLLEEKICTWLTEYPLYRFRLLLRYSYWTYPSTKYADSNYYQRDSPDDIRNNNRSITQIGSIESNSREEEAIAMSGLDLQIANA